MLYDVHLRQQASMMLYTKAEAPSVQFFVVLLLTCLHNMPTMNRTSGVGASSCTYVLKTDSHWSV